MHGRWETDTTSSSVCFHGIYLLSSKISNFLSPTPFLLSSLSSLLPTNIFFQAPIHARRCLGFVEVHTKTNRETEFIKLVE